jgi:protein-disulfide isomerase
MGNVQSIVAGTQSWIRLSLLVVLIPVLACDRAEVETAASVQPESAAGHRVVATVDGVPISAEQVETSLRLELHDLELARHRALIRQLRRLVAQHLGEEVSPGSAEWRERVEIRLEPPSPPRIEIPDGEGPVRGTSAAPVTIVEFLDFESPHCRRLQPILFRVLERHPGRVRLLVRDLPRAYHRHAHRAAVAARCAADQKGYWAYHDLLLLEQPGSSPPDLARYAARIGLEIEPFESCLDSDRHDAAISADLALGARLGVHRTPTVFVNGLYLGRQPGYDEIDRAIRSEIERLGLATSDPAEPNEGERDESGNDHGRASREGGRAYLSPLPSVPLEELPPPEVVVTLSRAEVDHALEDRKALDRKLEGSAGVFSGQRLLKLRTVEEGDFYARLGLQAGDVLMLVDGQFVTREQGSLWDAFEQGEGVTLLFMRRGLPHTYEYRIR